MKTCKLCGGLISTQDGEFISATSCNCIQPAREKVQNIVLTFNDGTKAVFSGRAVCEKGDTKTITDIKFTEPKDLPGDCYWESL